MIIKPLLLSSILGSCLLLGTAQEIYACGAHPCLIRACTNWRGQLDTMCLTRINDWSSRYGCTRNCCRCRY